MDWTDAPVLQSLYSPLFTTRGIHPFHDFLDGPDLWNVADYYKYLSQVYVLILVDNQIGFHLCVRLWC